MVSVLYFVGNIGGSKYFGKLALFQMMKGDFTFMPWMMAGAVNFAGSGHCNKRKNESVKSGKNIVPMLE